MQAVWNKGAHLLQGMTAGFYRTCALPSEFSFHLVLARNLRGRQIIVNQKTYFTEETALGEIA